MNVLIYLVLLLWVDQLVDELVDTRYMVYGVSTAKTY